MSINDRRTDIMVYLETMVEHEPTVLQTSTGYQTIVDIISSAIMSQVDTTIRREVADKLRTFGIV